MSVFAPLLRAAGVKEQGPSPSFVAANFVLAFLAIGDSGTIGRQALAKLAGLGEGAVRTVLKKLKASGYIRIGASGCSLTEEGSQIYGKIRPEISPIVHLERTPLTVGSKQSVIAVRGGAQRVRAGIEQRDAAVLVGASGATTYVIKDSRFAVPGGSSDCEKDFPSPVWKKLQRELKLRNGDAVVFCGSIDQMKSTLGALSAALLLV